MKLFVVILVLHVIAQMSAASGLRHGGTIIAVAEPGRVFQITGGGDYSSLPPFAVA